MKYFYKKQLLGFYEMRYITNAQCNLHYWFVYRLRQLCVVGNACVVKVMLVDAYTGA